MQSRATLFTQLTVRADLVHGRTEARQWTKDVGVDLTRVSLTGHRVGIREATKFSDTRVKSFHLISERNLKVSMAVTNARNRFNLTLL